MTINNSNSQQEKANVNSNVYGEPPTRREIETIHDSTACNGCPFINDCDGECSVIK